MRLLLVLVALGLPGCERLNPAWCSKPGRCPAGTRCDPSTNTCLAAGDGGGDRAVGLDRTRGEHRPDLPRHDAPPACVGGLGCTDGAVAPCREAGGVAKLRNCPLGACQSGHCLIPTGTRACAIDDGCPQVPRIWVCTWLLEGGKTPKQLCAPAVPGLDGPAPCSSGLDCATGLCTSEGRCYHACDGTTPVCSSPLTCQDSTINIEGVSRVVKSCR